MLDRWTRVSPNEFYLSNNDIAKWTHERSYHLINHYHYRFDHLYLYMCYPHISYQEPETKQCLKNEFNNDATSDNVKIFVLTFHCNWVPTSYSSLSVSLNVPELSNSLYLRYNSKAARASSAESWVSDWIFLPKKCQVKKRSDTIRWWGKWNNKTVSTICSGGTTKFITLQKSQFKFKKIVTNNKFLSWIPSVSPKIVFQTMSDENYAIVHKKPQLLIRRFQSGEMFAAEIRI